MNYKTLLTFLSVFILFVSCTSKQTQEEAQLREVKLDTLHTFMNYESHEIVQPGALAVLENGNLAVVDGKLKKVFIVNPEGELQAVFGKEGKGPGEFIRPAQIFGQNNLIHIVETNQYKVLEFDYNGNFIDSYPYQSKAFDRNIAVGANRVYYTGASGRNNSLIEKVSPDADSSLFFGQPKGDFVEEMDMEKSRNDFKNGKIPPYFKNNVNLFLDENHLYAFLDSYSELRKFDLNGNLVWSKHIELPDNQQVFETIIEAVTKAPRGLPFLRYTTDTKAYRNHIFLLGNKALNSPQHFVEVNEDGKMITIFQMPGKDDYFANFAISKDGKTLYLADPMNEAVYKTQLP